MEHGSKANRARCQNPNGIRRNIATVKPAKYNIPQFEGDDDAEHWIQIIEQYFDTSWTPLEQRTEFTIPYPKGPAV